MEANTMIEMLTPLDMAMPNTYVSALLTFRITDPVENLTQKLDGGLKELSKHHPSLTGWVVSTRRPQGHPKRLHIRWNSEAQSPKLIDKGSISDDYAGMSAQGMPSLHLPSHFWPQPSPVMEESQGVPVFVSSFFRFANNTGLGLCVSMHHNVVDVTAFATILQQWTEILRGESLSVFTREPRLDTLSKSLRTDLDAVAEQSLETILASHPEYSMSPPILPDEFPECTSKIFCVSVGQIEALKDMLKNRGARIPSTNTVLCTLLWQAITRARTLRDSDLMAKASRLVTAVNGRHRLSPKGSEPGTQYLGNLVLYARTGSSVADLIASNSSSEECLAKTCSSIDAAQSQQRIDSRFIAEAYSIFDRIDNFDTIFPGWDLFNSIDLTITSWANLGMYSLDFGRGLGTPDFVRVPHAAADGVAIILPRKRVDGKTSKGMRDIIEIHVMLRKDDMMRMESDSIWSGLSDGV